MNETIDSILTRRSIRKFNSSKQINQEDLQLLLEAGLSAPSAGNDQPWRITVVRNQELKQQLAAAALNQNFIAEAPVIIVVSGDMQTAMEFYSTRGVYLYIFQDCAAFVENVLIAAQSLGLATCWIGAFVEEKVQKVLQLPKNFRPMAMIPLGYAAESGREAPQKPLENFVEYKD